MVEKIITHPHFRRTIKILRKGSHVLAKFTGTHGTFEFTIEDYILLLNKQNGCCAICKTQYPAGLDEKYKTRNGDPLQRFSIDHDHKTGEVRGLLCLRCNGGLGYFRDSRQILLRAAIYLDDHAIATGKDSILNQG